MLKNKYRPIMFGFRTLCLLAYLKCCHKAKGWKYFFGGLDIIRIDEGTVELSSGTWIERCSLLHCVGGKIVIGERTFINRGVSVVCRENIIIGNDVLIGDHVSIYDHDHAFGDNKKPYGQQGYVAAPIAIEDNVWLGSHSVVLKGVTLGRNCIVAAGSVVNKSVPAGELWAGVPAKFLRKI